MARILAIDYGEKRVGLAHTDESQIIASPLETIDRKEIFHYLHDYLNKEDVDAIVIGDPKTLNNKPAEISKKIKLFIDKLKKIFTKPIHLIDERFTSKIALTTMIFMNTKKKHRRHKQNIDKISASLILQSYLDRNKES